MEDSILDHDNNVLTAIESAPTDSLTVITEEDQKLIDNTIDSIREIYKTGVIQTAIKVGELIFKNIFDNDIECFSQDKSAIKIRKRDMFERLLRKSNELAEGGDRLPKKSWLYNSVRLFVDNKLLSDSQDYKNLCISHKTALLRIKYNDTKIVAIKKIASEKLSVRDAIKYIDSLDEKKTYEKSIKYYINKPEIINIDDTLFKEKINSLNTDAKKEPVLSGCKKRIADIKELIGSYEKNIRNLEILMDRIEEVKMKEPRRVKNKTEKAE